MSSNTNGSTEPNQTTGQYHSVKGTVVETIGNLTGASSWTQSGREEHDAGETEYKAAQAKDWAEGVTDRAQGKIDSVAGAVKGDKEQQISGNAQHDKGVTQQRANE